MLCCCAVVRVVRCFVFVSFLYVGMCVNVFVCVVVLLSVFVCLLFAVFVCVAFVRCLKV